MAQRQSLRHGARSLRSRPSVRVAALVAGVLLVASPAAAAGVQVSKSIPFATGLRVRDAIRKDCNLQTVIPAEIAAHSSDVTLVDGKGNLELEISDVHGPGGWVFSGPKWVEVRGKLHRGGKVVGDFRAKRLSVADPTAGGTCGILQKCSRAIAEDIVLWLQDPTSGAELGDAR